VGGSGPTEPSQKFTYNQKLKKAHVSWRFLQETGPTRPIVSAYRKQSVAFKPTKENHRLQDASGLKSATSPRMGGFRCDLL